MHEVILTCGWPVGFVHWWSVGELEARVVLVAGKAPVGVRPEQLVP